MTEVAPPDQSWFRYLARRMPDVFRTPLRARIARELLADPFRSNRVIAGAAVADASTVRVVRLELEDSGVIPVHRHPSSDHSYARDLTAGQLLARDALAADPYRINADVASAAGVGWHVVRRERIALELAGEIPRWRGRWPSGRWPSVLPGAGTLET